jgi:hypothetical protein
MQERGNLRLSDPQHVSRLHLS